RTHVGTVGRIRGALGAVGVFIEDAQDGVRGKRKYAPPRSDFDTSIRRSPNREYRRENDRATVFKLETWKKPRSQRSVFSIETGLRTFINALRILGASFGMGCQRAPKHALRGHEIDGRGDRLRRHADPGPRR